MRITREADYAFRIMTYLAEYDGIIKDAKTISDELIIPLRFALKILHKLVNEKLVKSYKGVNGGYTLNLSSEKITLRHIFEAIDGELIISRCLDGGYECTFMKDDKSKCFYHVFFDEINMKIAQEFEKITLDMTIKR